MEAFLVNLAIKILRLIFGWLFKMLWPILRSILRLMWPVIRMLLIVAALIAAIIVLRQLLVRRSRLLGE